MRKTLVLAWLVLPVLTGCGDSPSATNDFSLMYAEGRDGNVEVSNLGKKPVHYNVLERNDASTIQWTRCTPANAGCPTLQPDATARLPYAQVGGFDTGDTEAIVYWWETEPDGAGGYQIGRKGSIIVQLR